MRETGSLAHELGSAAFLGNVQHAAGVELDAERGAVVAVAALGEVDVGDADLVFAGGFVLGHDDAVGGRLVRRDVRAGDDADEAAVAGARQVLSLSVDARWRGYLP